MRMDRVIAVRNTKTIYHDGTHCVKVFDMDYSKTDILNEALNHAKAEKLSVHVPHLLEVTTYEKQWAIVTEYINGKTMAQLMQENPENMEQLLEQFIELQKSIHNEDGFGFQKLRDKIEWKISHCELPESTKYELQTRLAAMPVHNVVVHGDFIPENVIIREDGTPFIIDWSHASSGNASEDAAKSYLHFCKNGKENLAEQYLKMYGAQSNTDVESIKQWIPIAAAELFCKAGKREREFYRRMADIIE